MHDINKKCQLKCTNHNKDGFPTPNNLECPDLVDNIISLFIQFPAWTNVLNCYYETAKTVSTSTGSEVFFRILRCEFDLSRPISINRFVLRYTYIMDGEIKIGRAMLKTLKIAQGMKYILNEVKNDKDLQINSESCTDNFETMKFNEDPLKTIKTKKENDESDHSDSSFKENSPVNVIRNGLCLPPISVDEEMYRFTNTCAFYSICEIIVWGYCKVDKFKNTIDNFLDSNGHTFLKLIKDYVESEFSLELLYSERASILKPLGTTKYNQVDCETNVTSLFEKLVKSFSEQLGKIECNDCNFSRTLHYQTRIVQKLEFIDCETMNNSLTSIFSKEFYKCRKCKNKEATLKFEIGAYIAFDVEQIFEDAAANSINAPKNILKAVNYLPVKLTIHNKDYRLLGVIAFVPVSSRTGSHYTAYIKETLYWVKKDSLHSTAE